MQFRMWDILFNVLLMVFWFGLWNRQDRETMFNPYLGPVARLGESIVGFLRPAFFGLPRRAILLVTLLALLLLRGLAAPSTPDSWILRIGFEVRAPGAGPLATCLAFSFLSFGIFLFKLWGFSLIYVRTRRGTAIRHTARTVDLLARPFTDLRPELRPVVLLGFGILLAFLVNSVGKDVVHWGFAGSSAAWPVRIPRYTVSALAGWVDILKLLQSLLIVLIIGSWVSMFASSHGIMMFCRDWTDFLLGPLRRFPIRIGMLDLTPLVFILAIELLIYPILMAVLAASYGNLP